MDPEDEEKAAKVGTACVGTGCLDWRHGSYKSGALNIRGRLLLVLCAGGRNTLVIGFDAVHSMCKKLYSPQSKRGGFEA